MRAGALTPRADPSGDAIDRIRSRSASGTPASKGLPHREIGRRELCSNRGDDLLLGSRSVSVTKSISLAFESTRSRPGTARSHASGAGRSLDTEEVRSLLLTRLNALVKGYSGVREIRGRRLGWVLFFDSLVNSVAHGFSDVPRLIAACTGPDPGDWAIGTVIVLRS